jgi:hypothetical protein
MFAARGSTENVWAGIVLFVMNRVRCSDTKNVRRKRMSEIRKVKSKPKNEPKIIGVQPIERKEPQIIDGRNQPSRLEVVPKPQGEVIPVRSHTRSRPNKEKPE